MKHSSPVYIIVAVCCLFFMGCFSGGDGSDKTESESESGVSIGSFTNGAFTPGSLNLGAGSTATISQNQPLTVTAVVVHEFDNYYYMLPVNVAFSSEFAANGLAGFENSLVTTENGIATTVYRGAGGEGTDTITATLMVNGETLKATGTVNLTASDSGHLEFISSSTDVIALKNTGGPGRPETAILVFKVLDDYGYEAANQLVDFELSTNIGNLSLSNDSASSDSEGLVQTTVNTGTVSTHIRVKATLRDADPTVSIVSDELLVSTGLPDQDSISISAETLNPEAWNYNNVEVPIIFQAADHFNNFVPDGTVVYFTTSQGSIDDYGTVENGVCEVTWRSGSPRSTPGWVQILAFCIGEESFKDSNGNGFFDYSDEFITATDLAEPFRDDDFDGIRGSFDPWWDYNNDGIYDGIPNGIYNGSLCSETAETQGLCTRELVYTQETLRLIMSGSFATINFSPASVQLTNAGQTIVISIADENNNPMPEGTTVSVSTDIGEIIGETSFTMGNTNIPGPTFYSILLEPKADDEKSSGYLQVSVQTPFNNKSTARLPIRR